MAMNDSKAWRPGDRTLSTTFVKRETLEQKFTRVSRKNAARGNHLRALNKAHRLLKLELNEARDALGEYQYAECESWMHHGFCAALIVMLGSTIILGALWYFGAVR